MKAKGDKRETTTRKRKRGQEKEYHSGVDRAARG